MSQEFDCHYLVTYVTIANMTFSLPMLSDN